MGRRKYTDNQLIEAVKNSLSIAGVLKYLGLSPFGSRYKIFNMDIERLGLDISHFTGQGHLKGKTHSWSKKRPLNEILVQNSNYTSIWLLKRRLIRAGLLRNGCYVCGIDKWCGKKLNLQLDHINGNNRDHRLENLRMICPNCHSQTETFAGRNVKNNLLSASVAQCRGG